MEEHEKEEEEEEEVEEEEEEEVEEDGGEQEQEGVGHDEEPLRFVGPEETRVFDRGFFRIPGLSPPGVYVDNQGKTVLPKDLEEMIEPDFLFEFRMLALRKNAFAFFRPTADEDPSFLPFARRFWAARLANLIENAGAQAACLVVMGSTSGDLCVLPAELRKHIGKFVYTSRNDTVAWAHANEVAIAAGGGARMRPEVVLDIITPFGSRAFGALVASRLKDDPFAVQTLFNTMKYKKGDRLWANPPPLQPATEVLHRYRAWGEYCSDPFRFYESSLSDPFLKSPFCLRVERKYTQPYAIRGGMMPGTLALEVDVFLDTKLSLDEMRQIFESITDAHCLSESLAPLDEYTGERVGNE